MSTRSEQLRSALDCDIPIEAIRAYCEDVGVSYGLESIEEAYNGEWQSEEDFATNLLEECGDLPREGLAQQYFDYEAFTRDLFMGDYVSAPAPHWRVYVFRSL